MPPAGHRPEWPDKAMFAAILLILAGAVGLAFVLVKPMMTIDEEGLPTVFVDDIPGYTVALCAATVVAGVLSLLRQAAVFAYAGALFALLSLAVYGLVPALGLLAVVAMVKSHLEGEETRDDGIEMEPSRWPDKALATSLFLVVVGAIAITQGLLLLADRLSALVWGDSTVAGWLAIAVGVLGLVAGREVFHLRRPWLDWAGLVLGLATMGFFLIGPVLAIVGLVLLALAHREQEFLIHGGEAQDLKESLEATVALAAKPKRAARRRGRGRGRKPAAS